MVKDPKVLFENNFVYPKTKEYFEKGIYDIAVYQKLIDIQLTPIFLTTINRV